MRDDLVAAVARQLGHDFRPTADRTPVAGGSINSAWCLGDGRTSVFVKTNLASARDMFEAEADGLRALEAAGGIRVPHPLAVGTSGDQAYIVMEWLVLQGRGDWAAMGDGLAIIHRSCAERYGWHRDNTIGSTHQPNSRSGDWADFLARQRLGFQLELAAKAGAGGTLIDAGQRLQEALPALFSGYQPVPSLLHGDLWSGNVAFDGSGNPVIFDPAVYYGDRESDLAMTELFGGFPDAFYRAYESAWPLEPGYAIRRDLYQLYHVLNHGNLFGGGYWRQAETMIRRLLAEV